MPTMDSRASKLKPRIGGRNMTRITTKLGESVLFVLMFILAVLFVLPFIWTAFSSLKSYGEIYTYPPTLLPNKPVWNNYRVIFTRVPFLRFIYNTLGRRDTFILAGGIFFQPLSLARTGYLFYHLLGYHDATGRGDTHSHIYPL